jgi:hypothetical protein
MKYRLVCVEIFRNGDVAGVVYDENDNVIAQHISSSLSWLEFDLLRDCNYDDIKDTYTKNWE